MTRLVLVLAPLVGLARAPSLDALAHEADASRALRAPHAARILVLARDAWTQDEGPASSPIAATGGSIHLGLGAR